MIVYEKPLKKVYIGTFFKYICNTLKPITQMRWLRHVTEDVVQVAKDGLERRGFKELGFLNEVAEVVRTGVTPTEKLLELYNGKWEQSVDPVFEELLY